MTEDIQGLDGLVTIVRPSGGYEIENIPAAKGDTDNVFGPRPDQKR